MNLSQIRPKEQGANRAEHKAETSNAENWINRALFALYLYFLL